ncbi:globin [Deinococcus deserti]|uniref:Putative globin n=1 Tax=Deinococcus deserti (strain DSM 17065 / CIP 109153 / LMG 22923 / VCD115) TaxID=546414 RepID=C1D0M8_DEIDV|nr:globin [Deinococcus deserti]ACO45402.1 putative globin [Deinococcus deserti VCD115]
MSAPMSLSAGGSLYERIGPQALKALVDRFYSLVAADPDLAPIFPSDLGHTADKQLAFLTGFLGGPPLYHQRYGHPRLRARHLPFPITPELAQAWLRCMKAALQQTPEISPDDARELYAALSRVAIHMVNTPAAGSA